MKSIPCNEKQAKTYLKRREIFQFTFFGDIFYIHTVLLQERVQLSCCWVLPLQVDTENGVVHGRYRIYPDQLLQQNSFNAKETSQNVTEYDIISNF